MEWNLRDDFSWTRRHTRDLEIKSEEPWRVSNVSIIFDCSMLYYILFWTLMGFIMHFYIIFGTNLLTGGPAQNCCFLPISVFLRKGISNGIQTEWNLREDLFWNKRTPGDMKWRSRKQRGGHDVGRRALHPRWPLVAPPTYFFRLYILLCPENIQGSHETTFPPPQPSVLVRSHLGTFFGDPPEGDLMTEGFYINTIASPMMCE